MKKLLLLAFCVLLAAGSSEARTLYVNAKRPNNNGSGLKAKTAKKTIQAAINIAKKGDTILVYPGTYASIKTNNKKITVKSVKGAKKTKIAKSSKNSSDKSIAHLGKGADKWAKGSNSRLTGFVVDGLQIRSKGYAIAGGQVTSCTIQRAEGIEAGPAVNAKLTACVVQHNHCLSTSGSSPLQDCTLLRCKILHNTNYYPGRSGRAFILRCKLGNCLLVDNGNEDIAPIFEQSVFANCTITKNTMTHDGKSAKISIKSKYYNCILRDNISQRTWKEWDDWYGYQTVTGSPTIHNVDSGNGYNRTYKDNRDPKFVDAAKGNYKLKKGSPCINKGKVFSAIKSLVGTKDLAGAKRIRGKAIDMGCYEY